MARNRTRLSFTDRRPAATHIVANLADLLLTRTTRQPRSPMNPLVIGFNYLTVNSYSLPGGTGGDVISADFPDANLNATVDSGEINWMVPNDLGLKVIITRPKNNSVIP
jgi:hypothetical protein